MPIKKREVQIFATRLNPALVRKLDAYAAQSNLSRNQVIEKMLTEYWNMQHALHSYRQIVRELDSNQEELTMSEVADRAEEFTDYQQLVAAEKLADPKFFEKANKAAQTLSPRKKKGDLP